MEARLTAVATAQKAKEEAAHEKAPKGQLSARWMHASKAQVAYFLNRYSQPDDPAGAFPRSLQPAR
eukprot:1031308-Alexandrium_andersonii.AAC.1